MAPCVKSPHPETDRLEDKQLRVCLLPWRVVILSKTKVKSIWVIKSAVEH